MAVEVATIEYFLDHSVRFDVKTSLYLLTLLVKVSRIDPSTLKTVQLSYDYVNDVKSIFIPIECAPFNVQYCTVSFSIY